MYLTNNGFHFWIISDTDMGSTYTQSIEAAFTEYYNTREKPTDARYNIDLVAGEVTVVNYHSSDIDRIIAILPNNTTYLEFTHLHPELLI